MRTLFLFLVLAIPCVVHAQFAEDVRLSAIEPLVHNLPEEYRIQSADSAGNRTLVVWGTSRNLSQEEVAGQLRYQILDGATPADTQRALTSDEAFPHTYVRVVSLSSRFLVLWLDARPDSAGLYGAVLDSTGAIIYPEFRLGPEIAPHKKLGTRVFVAGTPDEGRLVMWHINDGQRTSTTGIRISPEGIPVSEAIEIGHILQEVLPYGRFQDMTVLQFDSSTALIRHDGAIEEREVKDSLLRGVFAADTSVARLNGSTIENYASPFATAPDWTIQISALDSAAGQTGLLTRDSSGRLVLYYVTIGLEGHYPGTGRQYTNGYRIFIYAPDSISATEHIYSDTSFYGYLNHSDGFDRHYRTTWSSPGLENSGLLHIELECTTYYHGTPLKTEICYQYFSVDSAGNFVVGDSGYKQTYTEHVMAVSRADIDASSSVTLYAADSFVTLQATAARTQLDTDQCSPVLMALDDTTVSCFWIDLKSGYALSQVSIPFDSTPAPIQYFTSPEPGPPEIRDNWASEVQITRHPDYNEVSLNTASNAVIVANEFGINFDVIEIYTPTYTESYRISHHGYQLTLPDPQGWSPIYKEVAKWHSREDGSFRYIRGRVLGYNTARKEWTIATQVTPSRRKPEGKWELSTITNSGEKVWGIDSLETIGGTFISLDKGLFILANESSASLYTGDGIQQTFQFKSQASAHFIALSSSSFLRYYTLGNDDIWQLEKYTAQGGLEATTRVTFSHMQGLPAFIINQENASIAVLFGTNSDGIHATFLDSTLRVRISDTLVSRLQGKAIAPSGLYYENTLHVVWEDYRNGTPDIYGNAFSWPNLDTTILTASRQAVPKGIEVYPNPARERFTIEIDPQTGTDISLQILDVAGRTVSNRILPHGARVQEISVTHLPAGIYHLHWKAGNGSGTERIVVVR